MTTRLLVASIVMFTATLAAAPTQDDPVMSVEVSGGVYVVAARFSVPEPAGVVREVLTDYASIPRFMPDVRTSAVIERQEGYARVEQETVSKFMLFSKRVHLVLDVDEGAGVIRFRDRCKRSFLHYEGAWTISDQGGRTEITYELNAQPAFSVPEFVLRKLLNRDARAMIARLRAEVSSRATPPSSTLSPR
jgi:ribosome-associated toxin RatA of RatAB toxin-antitoxin module